MQNIGFIGLGITGNPMANKYAGLIEEDFSVVCKAVKP